MYNLGKADPTNPSRTQSDTIAVLKLVANAEQHFNAPTGATIAVFSGDVNFWVLVNGQTAAIPAATSTSFPGPNTVPELNPTVLRVVAGTAISVISSSAGFVGISFYRNIDP